MSAFKPLCMLCGNSGRIVENEIVAGRPHRYLPCPNCRPEAYKQQERPAHQPGERHGDR